MRHRAYSIATRLSRVRFLPITSFSPTPPPTSSNRITQASDNRITEAGDQRITQ